MPSMLQTPGPISGQNTTYRISYSLSTADVCTYHNSASLCKLTRGMGQQESGWTFFCLKPDRNHREKSMEWGPSLSPSQPTGTTITSISLYSITTLPYSFILFADTQPVGLWLITAPLAGKRKDLAGKDELTCTAPSLLNSKELREGMGKSWAVVKVKKPGN